MDHGGYRENAGRKKGVGNYVNETLRDKIDAEALIRFLQDVALGGHPEATLGERKDAAAILLKKVLPDCQSLKTDMNLETADDRNITVTISRLDDPFPHPLPAGQSDVGKQF